jgi:hypothetical protein
VTLSNVSFVSATLVTATVTLDASLPTQTACVMVGGIVLMVARQTASADPNACPANVNGAQTWTAPVQICATPTVTSVSPNVWLAGNTYDVTVTGTGFIPDSPTPPAACPATTATATVVQAQNRTANTNSLARKANYVPVSPPAFANLPISNVQVVSPTTITFTVTPSIPTLTQGFNLFIRNRTVPPTSATFQVEIIANPQIWWQGNSISALDGSQATQTVNIGDEVDFTTTPADTDLAGLPIPVSFESNTWDVGGINIGGWVLGALNATATTIIAPMDTQDLTTYWISQNPSNAVSYQFCIPSQTNGPILDCSGSAYATFDVEGPDASILASTALPKAAGYYFVLPPNTACPVQWLNFGIPTLQQTCPGPPSIPGIFFQANINDDAGGAFNWVQLIAMREVVSSNLNGSFNSPAYEPVGLDNTFPYPALGSVGLDTYDAPALSLGGSIATLSDNFIANMYLEWTSPNTDANPIPVPIGYVNWNIQGAAQQTVGASPPWTLKGQVPPAVTNWTTDDPTGPAPGMPTWTNVSVNGVGMAYGVVSTDEEKEKK